MMISSTDMRGLSAPYGVRNAAAVSRVMFVPSKRISPLVDGSSRISKRPRVDLLQPDSPTRPSVSPDWMVSATSSTARNGILCRCRKPPVRMAKCLVRPSASTSGVTFRPPPELGCRPRCDQVRSWNVPMHGDHKRLHLHADLAEAVGVPRVNIFTGENGLPLENDESGARWGKPEQSGMVFVDGVEIGDVADVALRDRRMLSADGIFIVVATIAAQDGSSVVPPEVLARGVPFIDDTGDQFVDELREAVEDALDRAAEQGIHDIEPLRAVAARRSGELHLRPSQASADGAARRRRSLNQT